MCDMQCQTARHFDSAYHESCLETITMTLKPTLLQHGACNVYAGLVQPLHPAGLHRFTGTVRDHLPCHSQSRTQHHAFYRCTTVEVSPQGKRSATAINMIQCLANGHLQARPCLSLATTLQLALMGAACLYLVAVQEATIWAPALLTLRFSRQERAGHRAHPFLLLEEAWARQCSTRVSAMSLVARWIHQSHPIHHSRSMKPEPFTAWMCTMWPRTPGEKQRYDCVRVQSAAGSASRYLF
jgi:hypothetical protein